MAVVVPSTPRGWGLLCLPVPISIRANPLWRRDPLIFELLRQIVTFARSVRWPGRGSQDVSSGTGHLTISSNIEESLCHHVAKLWQKRDYVWIVSIWKRARSHPIIKSKTRKEDAKGLFISPHFLSGKKQARARISQTHECATPYCFQRTLFYYFIHPTALCEGDIGHCS